MYYVFIDVLVAPSKFNFPEMTPPPPHIAIFFPSDVTLQDVVIRCAYVYANVYAHVEYFTQYRHNERERLAFETRSQRFEFTTCLGKHLLRKTVTANITRTSTEVHIGKKYRRP